jgi:hypothetical protein
MFAALVQKQLHLFMSEKAFVHLYAYIMEPLGFRSCILVGIMDALTFAAKATFFTYQCLGQDSIPDTSALPKSVADCEVAFLNRLRTQESAIPEQAECVRSKASISSCHVRSIIFHPSSFPSIFWT